MIGLNGLKIMSILKLKISWRIVKKILKSVWSWMLLLFHFKTNNYKTLSLLLIVLSWNNNLYSSSSSKEWFWTFSLVIYSIFILSSSIGCGMYLSQLASLTICHQTKVKVIEIYFFCFHCCKGQLISKANFEVFIWTKNERKYFSISALAY